MSQITLSQINIYPIKSAAGVSVSTATLEARGLAYDRRWMLVDTAGHFITQRHYPQMAKLMVSIESEGLQVSYPGKSPIQVPEGGGGNQSVIVWGDTVRAEGCGSEVDEWFSDVMSMPCALVYMPTSTLRGVDPRYDPHQSIVSFADGFPLLVLTEASLSDLNQRLAMPVTMDRFRPNLVFSGTAPYAEDQWRTLSVGESVIEVVKPCSRCAMITVDQQAGVKASAEPLKVLNEYRRQDKNVYFGQNAVVLNAGVLEVGMVMRQG